jgi:hypothetical protein
MNHRKKVVLLYFVLITFLLNWNALFAQDSSFGISIKTNLQSNYLKSTLTGAKILYNRKINNNFDLRGDISFDLYFLKSPKIKQLTQWQMASVFMSIYYNYELLNHNFYSGVGVGYFYDRADGSSHPQYYDETHEVLGEKLGLSTGYNISCGTKFLGNFFLELEYLFIPTTFEKDLLEITSPYTQKHIVDHFVVNSFHLNIGYIF